jgi:hypothetical protein
VADDISLRIRGLSRVIAATTTYPQQVQTELRLRRRALAQRFARIVAASGRADSRQSARAAGTVKALTAGGDIRVVAGPHPLLFGSEYGANGRYGWYSKPQYRFSPLRQFRPHRGAASYWFHRTVQDNQAMIDAEWRQASEAIVRAWGA